MGIVTPPAGIPRPFQSKHTRAKYNLEDNVIIIPEDCVFTGGWRHGCCELKFEINLLQIHRLREAEYPRF
jgi:hypothetical protein